MVFCRLLCSGHARPKHPYIYIMQPSPQPIHERAHFRNVQIPTKNPVVGPDGIEIGSDADMAWETVFRPCDLVVLHPDFPGVSDPRMVPHLLP